MLTLSLTAVFSFLQPEYYAAGVTQKPVGLTRRGGLQDSAQEPVGFTRRGGLQNSAQGGGLAEPWVFTLTGAPL